jgi:hypothetical protein
MICLDLEGRQFHNNEQVEVAFLSGCICLSRNFYCDGIFTVMSRWDSCIKTFGDYVEK